MSRSKRVFTWLFVLAAAIPSLAAGGDSPGRESTFLDRLRPVLQSRCVSCHGPDKQEGGLRLDSAGALLEGGTLGPAVVAGDPEASPLVRAVRQSRHAGPPVLDLKAPDRLPATQRSTLDLIQDLNRKHRDGRPDLDGRIASYELAYRMQSQAVGATDEIGLRAEESLLAGKDLHATILKALGLYHEDLSFENNGRPERLTGVAGSARAVPGVLS